MIYINGRFLINNPTGIENFAYGMCKAMLEKGIKFIILTPKSAIRSYDVIGFDMIKIVYWSALGTDRFIFLYDWKIS
jgi:hypothetical protein